MLETQLKCYFRLRVIRLVVHLLLQYAKKFNRFRERDWWTWSPVFDFQVGHQYSRQGRMRRPGCRGSWEDLRPPQAEQRVARRSVRTEPVSTARCGFVRTHSGARAHARRRRYWGLARSLSSLAPFCEIINSMKSQIKFNSEQNLHTTTFLMICITALRIIYKTTVCYYYL